MSNVSANIKYIKDDSDNIVLPVTHEKSVVDSNGVNLETKLGQKQNTLVSGTNIKTINNESILGSGNIAVSDVIPDISTIREGASAGATAYQKPVGGIPDSDLSSTVQTSLGKADTALQSHQDISGKEDMTNKVTSLSSSSNNTQYPSALCVYNLVTALESPLDYTVVATRPTASASTMGKVYIVTGESSSEMFVTTESEGTYSWNQVGTINESVSVITTGEIDALFE